MNLFFFLKCDTVYSYLLNSSCYRWLREVCLSIHSFFLLISHPVRLSILSRVMVMLSANYYATIVVLMILKNLIGLYSHTYIYSLLSKGIIHWPDGFSLLNDYPRNLLHNPHAGSISMKIQGNQSKIRLNSRGRGKFNKDSYSRHGEEGV